MLNRVNALYGDPMLATPGQFTILPHRALIAVRGDDRVNFLQGLVSNDMLQVQSGSTAWSAFLTPQGKFLHEFFAIPAGETIYLECERARRDDLITRLSRYKLRAKVTLAGDDTLTVGVAWGEDVSAVLKTSDKPGYVTSHGRGVLYTDPRLPGAGIRWALMPEQIEAFAKAGLAAATPDDYDALRFTLGLPDGSRDMEVEKALLLENGFEELHGVDFNKGCYIGQELTARTHYRALIKKRLMPVKIDGETPASGTPLTVDGAEAGTLMSAAGGAGLALIRLEAWKKSGGTLEAGLARVTPHQPAWIKLPEA